MRLSAAPGWWATRTAAVSARDRGRRGHLRQPGLAARRDRGDDHHHGRGRRGRGDRYEGREQPGARVLTRRFGPCGHRGQERHALVHRAGHNCAYPHGRSAPLFATLPEPPAGEVR
ncbi:hypothetical protein TN53_10005 [Streptomyces sp. WM6386]|nr:hypothetical protein TN53_10005 [Streptomyces sp. WM6386]